MCSDLYIHPLGGEKETLKYVIINSLRVLFWSVCDFKVEYPERKLQMLHYETIKPGTLDLIKGIMAIPLPDNLERSR
jgi:hypothetical protein